MTITSGFQRTPATNSSMLSVFVTVLAKLSKKKEKIDDSEKFPNVICDKPNAASRHGKCASFHAQAKLPGYHKIFTSKMA